MISMLDGGMPQFSHAPSSGAATWVHVAKVACMWMLDKRIARGSAICHARSGHAVTTYKEALPTVFVGVLPHVVLGKGERF